MSGKINYQKKLEKLIEENRISGKRPALLIHACCAPCSSYVLEYLNRHFDMTFFYYNPNIDTEKEYYFRQSELKRLIGEMPTDFPAQMIENIFEPQLYYLAVKGYENTGEGGERCMKCFELRLRQTAVAAKAGKYDYFSTTLTISPMKNAEAINSIGEKISQEVGIAFLTSDFKKNNGYKRSVELSKEYSLYRQNYCGCSYSRKEAESRGTVKTE